MSAPLDNENIHNTADDPTPYIDLVACPECTMTAAVQGSDRLESTDGPVEHVRVTCVNRHWFVMPADTLTQRRRNHLSVDGGRLRSGCTDREPPAPSSSSTAATACMTR